MAKEEIIKHVTEEDDEGYGVIRIEDLKFKKFADKFSKKLDDEYDKKKGLNTEKITSKEFDEGFLKVADFLYMFLPYYLGEKFHIPFGNIGFFSRHGKVITKDFLDFLTSNKFITPPLKKSAEELYKLKAIPKNYEKVVLELTKHYIEDLGITDTHENATLKAFVTLVKDKKLNDRALETLIKNKSWLENFELVRQIKLIHNKANESTEERDKLKKVLEKETKRIFKTDNPDEDEEIKVKEQNKELFEQWRKLKNDVVTSNNDILRETWKLEGYKIETPAKANALLKKLGIESSIDPGFVGLVKPSRGRSVQFTFYTEDGLELDKFPGRNVVMNPNYSREADNYYCKGESATGQKTQITCYTIEHQKAAKDRLFTNAQKMLENAEDIRIQTRKDIFSDKPHTKYAALVIALLDITAGRIEGTPEKEKVPSYGISTLMWDHLTIEGNKAIFNYIGKSEEDFPVQQTHTIKDKDIVNELKKLKKERKAGEYLFSPDGGKSPISAATVRKRLKEFGFEDATPHIYRKYHANLIFSEIVEKKFKTKDEAKAALDEIAKKIAKKLGNTPTMAIQKYTSPHMIKSFLDLNGFDLKKDKLKAVYRNTIKTIE